MKKMKQIWGKMDISMRLLFTLWIPSLINVLFIFTDGIKYIRAQLVLLLIPIPIIHEILKRKPEEYNEEEKKILYKRRELIAIIFLLHMLCLESGLVLLKFCFKPSWVVTIFIIVSLSVTIQVMLKYFILIRYISKEFKINNKGE